MQKRKRKAKVPNNVRHPRVVRCKHATMHVSIFVCMFMCRGMYVLFDRIDRPTFSALSLTVIYFFVFISRFSFFFWFFLCFFLNFFFFILNVGLSRILSKRHFN